MLPLVMYSHYVLAVCNGASLAIKYVMWWVSSNAAMRTVIGGIPTNALCVHPLCIPTLDDSTCIYTELKPL